MMITVMHDSSSNLLTNLTSRFSGTIHCNFDGLAVDSNPGWHARDHDVQVEALAAATAANEAEIVELGDVVLHDGRVVPQLPTKVLIVASSQSDHSPIIDLTQGNHFEGGGKSFV